MFLHHALDLLQEVAVGAIRAAGIELKDIGAIVVNTITGVAIPSLDAKLMNRLDLASVVSAALFGDGAAGVVLRNTKRARPIAGGRGRILAAQNTEHIMGWDIRHDGFPT